MTTKLEELQEKVNFWLHWLAIVVTSVVLVVVVTIIYWVLEPDPFAGHLQNQPRISQSSVGAGYSSFGKDQSWFVDVYKLNSNYYGDGHHVFGYYSKNIGRSYRAVGFVEVIDSENKSIQPVTFSQVSFQRKVMDVWVGVEHQRYFNKNGVKGLDESVNQLMIKWEF